MTRFALISVSDKTGIVDFARSLSAMGISILSTGGTASLLQENGIFVTEVADYTGFPEMLDGRVKTLHPRIHGGILARRDLDSHTSAIAKHGISAIDMVVVNLYPFEQTIASPQCTLEDAIENIDIGGPAMLRSAAKNYRDVTVICDPADYSRVLEEMRQQGGMPGENSRFELAAKTFAHTARYDGAIANYLSSLGEEKSHATRAAWPQTLNLQFEKVQEMRYGENPHQSAAFYREHTVPGGALAGYTQLQGKELSYNNISDADAAWECVKTFDEPACVIIKHANPCGVATGSDPAEAYMRALQTDPEAAFGGIIAFNRELDQKAAEEASRLFVEVLIAPAFSPEARAIFSGKKNVRLLEIPPGNHPNDFEVRRVGGGLLLQSPDIANIDVPDLSIVTQKEPSPQQLRDMLFAWRVAKFVKSNAIVFCRDGMTLAIGAGQVSRVDAARTAVMKAKNAGLSLADTAVASDAFFPFRDGLDIVADAGATSIIQPGGSIRDQEVIDAANERGLTMAFTAIRHFRH
ncbi:MAG: bifunctional phosphoribosylaminoimidazolecarboxamide formyltransferase/IMP cyclohydrolase [Burkholderiaceae bacterium]|jgi:phosphoribosylaminoimidazolecarboxamide formyltransferase/IMP cyclohydrolase|nr:bifunctional phosphoribosylaminoimidazolecarboxamide formyltransferase/IMP cyclohydrolase [Burkholderiaceae bacterium]